VHVPPATNVAVAPDTVHTAGVALLNVTGCPDVAVADRPTEPAVSAVSAVGVQLIVWASLVTSNESVTCGAAS
jgi:hypothetical protein